jgi:uncharacterized protein
MANVDLPGPAGRLEAINWKVAGAKTAAVVCHPHPLFGGTMHNHVTFRVAQAFRDAGASALRFNFRGVGRSEGKHAQGDGEVDDAAAALDELSHDNPGAALYAAGFSFGARVALRLAARDGRVKKALAVGLATSSMDLSFVGDLDKPLAVIQADRDEHGSLESVKALLQRRKAKTQLFVLADSDHLCTGRLKELEKVAKSAAEWILSA